MYLFVRNVAFRDSEVARKQAKLVRSPCGQRSEAESHEAGETLLVLGNRLGGRSGNGSASEGSSGNDGETHVDGWVGWLGFKSCCGRVRVVVVVVKRLLVMLLVMLLDDEDRFVDEEAKGICIFYSGVLLSRIRHIEKQWWTVH